MHDGNFVADGLLFPDRTPSPGLIELKKVFEPVRITEGVDGGLRIENRFTFRDLSHLAFVWLLEEEGAPVAAGELRVGSAARGRGRRAAAAGRPAARTAGETWLTVRAVLAADEPWAPAGHEVAWGQCRSPARRRRASVPGASRGSVAFGPAPIRSARPACCRGSAALELIGPRLDVWRAPTDNDEGYHGPEQLGPLWRAHGLDRMRHRTISVERDGDALVVRTRVAPAASDLGLLATYTWTAEDGALALALEVVPDGEWSFPLPRLGVRFAVPASLDGVEWFGRGPGEAYPDTHLAARVGRFSRARSPTCRRPI